MCVGRPLLIVLQLRPSVSTTLGCLNWPFLNLLDVIIALPLWDLERICEAGKMLKFELLTSLQEIFLVFLVVDEASKITMRMRYIEAMK